MFSAVVKMMLWMHAHHITELGFLSQLHSPAMLPANVFTSRKGPMAQVVGSQLPTLGELD